MEQSSQNLMATATRGTPFEGVLCFAPDKPVKAKSSASWASVRHCQDVRHRHGEQIIGIWGLNAHLPPIASNVHSLCATYVISALLHAAKLALAQLDGLKQISRGTGKGSET